MTDDAIYIKTQGSGQHIVLVHGWGLASTVWQPIARQLATHYKVSVVDIPGYGHSALPQNEYTLKNISQQLANAIPEPSIWVGWSLGGLITTSIALNHPQQVTALINVTSSPKFLDSQDWPGVKAGVLENFSQMLAKDFDNTIKRFIALQFLGMELATKLVNKLYNTFLAHPKPQSAGLYSGLQILQQADLRDDINTLTCPTLYIFGKRDAIVPVKVAKSIEKLSEHIEIEVIPKAGHAPFISHPQEFINVIEQFINEHT